MNENFQVWKLDLGKAEDQKSNDQHPLVHRKSERISEKNFFIDDTKFFDCVNHNKLWKLLKR